MKPLLIFGIASALIGGAFVAGRMAATRSAPATEMGMTPAADKAAGAGTAGATQDSTKPGRELDVAQLQSRPVPEVPKTEVKLAPAEETPEATIARRVETDTRLTKELGKISDEQRQQLMDLNDRAIEFQRRLAGEFQQGAISHEDYMEKVHEEMLNQLEELNALVSADQYRLLTGLEPGADPFDYMTSGVGAAQAAKTEVGGAL
jgi:hypothetical protein